MSIYSVQEFDLLIEKATSESIPNGELDLPFALEVSDVVRSRKLPPKDCMRCLKKRVASTTSNPNTQLSSWKLVDVCVKNGGTSFLIEICSREFMDTFEHTILSLNDHGVSTDNDELYTTVTKLFYELYIAFKNDSQLHYISNVYSKLKSRGVEFPTHLVDESNPMAMFDSKTPADWVDSDACMICSKKFSMLNRRHHCRSCGGIFCQEHSSHNIPLPDLGITDPVRVCDNCFEDYDLKKHKGHKKKSHSSKKKRNSESYSSDNEDEDLKRAIALSLQETGSIAPESPSPVIQPVRQSSQETEMEEDPDLKAAIEASLREAEEAKARNSYPAASIQNNDIPQYTQPSSNDLTVSEEEDIYLFASLVEKMKTQSVTDILEDTQLQRLYQKVIASKPKINSSLNDKINKYNTLIDMNSKISDIMNIYDSLLEQQLRNINISQQYSLPQQPSDPYAITQPLPSVPQANQAQSVQNTYAHSNQPMQQQVPPQYAPAAQESVPVHGSAQDTQQRVYPQQEELQQNFAQVPSEPPYPEEEPETKENAVEESKPTTSEPTQGDALPYPNEPTEQPNGPQKITNFDFPAVPAHKVQGTTPYNEEAVPSEPPAEEVEEPKEEELLLEL